MKVTKGLFELSTGRKIYANRGIIGLSAIEENLFSGYDDEIFTSNDWTETPWTQSERKELADYMIELWNSWGKKK